jgi:outer membrane lipoprotein carrier protein
MRVLIICFSILLIAVAAYPQNDPEAVKILDIFSARALAAPSVSMAFSLETVDQVEGSSNTVEGSIILNKDRYKLSMPDNIIWFNGETSWSYLPAEKEVTIVKPDKLEDSFLTRPSSIFTIYKKGYKTRLLEENGGSYIIDLYPEALDSDHVRIRLSIAKKSLDLQGVEYKYKNGITVFLTVKGYDLTKKPDNSDFIFQAGKYKGVEVIDMR